MSKKFKAKRVHTMPPTIIWFRVRGYVCKHCSTPACKHPKNEWLWRCVKCDFITRDLAFHFTEVKREKRAAA